MKDNNYIVIQGWMVSRLKLTGNALMVYACIFGFSQDGEWFTGTAGYLADWCDCQKKYMLKLLKKMTDEGLLRKRTREQNGVAFCDYQAITPEERCEQQHSAAQRQGDGQIHRSHCKKQRRYYRRFAVQFRWKPAAI